MCRTAVQITGFPISCPHTLLFPALCVRKFINYRNLEKSGLLHNAKYFQISAARVGRWALWNEMYRYGQKPQMVKGRNIEEVGTGPLLLRAISCGTPSLEISLFPVYCQATF